MLKHSRLFQQLAFAEPLDSKRGSVYRARLAIHYQLRNDAARRGRVHHSMPAEAISQIQSFNAPRASYDRVMIRRHFVQPCPAAARVHFRIGKAWHAAHGPGQNPFDEFMIERGIEALRKLARIR